VLPGAGRLTLPLVCYFGLIHGKGCDLIKVTFLISLYLVPSWKSGILWAIVALSLVIPGCTNTVEWEPPTATPGPSPTPIPPAIYALSEKMDEEGVLIEDCDLASTDGRAVLHLEKGTRVLNEGGQSIQSITITTRPPKAQIEYSAMSSPTYEIDPRGAILEPPGQLSINYDNPSIFLGVDPHDPQMGASCGELEIDWEILDTQADIDSLTATADVDRLGSFIVIFLVRIIS